MNVEGDQDLLEFINVDAMVEVFIVLLPDAVQLVAAAPIRAFPQFHAQGALDVLSLGLYRDVPSEVHLPPGLGLRLELNCGFGVRVKCKMRRLGSGMK